MNHNIIIDTELPNDEGLQYAELIKRSINAALDNENMALDCEINVLITDNQGIKNVNLQQRGIDSATDVLSFPMFNLVPEQPVTEDSDDEAELDPATDLLPLGDMLISLERCEQQAQEYGHSVQRELAYLTVHSTLHLLGFDHMDGDDGPDKLKMRKHEKIIMSKLDILR